MDSTAASPSTRVATATRAAGVVYVATGIGFGVGAVISLLYLARNGELPMTPFGFRSLSGPFEALGTVWLSVFGWVFVGVCAVETLAGWKLWTGQRRGASLGIATTPLAVMFGLGFALPFYLASIPIRLVLLALGRRAPALSELKGASMPTYLRPRWEQRHLESALMMRMPGQPCLRVRGRSSGRTRALPVRPVAVGDARYLVALLGDTNWARNLRAGPTATLVERRVEREIQAVEVFGEERAAAVAAYLATSTYAPTIRLLTQRLPDPADHPVFRIDDI